MDKLLICKLCRRQSETRDPVLETKDPVSELIPNYRCADCISCDRCNDCYQIVSKSELVKGSCRECNHIIIKCNLCLAEYPKYKNNEKDLTQHLDFNCPRDLVKCNRCYEYVERKYQLEHCPDEKLITMKLLLKYEAQNKIQRQYQDNLIEELKQRLITMTQELESLRQNKTMYESCL